MDHIYLINITILIHNYIYFKLINLFIYTFKNNFTCASFLLSLIIENI